MPLLSRDGLPSVALNPKNPSSSAPPTKLRRTPSFALNPTSGFRAKDGGADRNRTCDLLIANETLYQLSYDPIQNGATMPGISATASRFQADESNRVQLSNRELRLGRALQDWVRKGSSM